MASQEEAVQKQLADKKRVHTKIWKCSWELMAVDDLNKCIVLDPFIGFKSHKIDKNSFLYDDIRLKIEEKFNEFSPVHFGNLSTLQKELLNLVKSYKLLYKFNVQYLSWLDLMVNSYLKVISIESPVNIEECNRYQGDNFKGVKIVANKMIKKDSTLHILTGYYKYVDEKTCEFLESRKLDFSIMISGMKNCDFIMLGPAALPNHDCNPNCEYMSATKESIKIKTVKNIQAGKEWFCYYGNDYFGKRNEECACRTCEENQEGYDKPVNGSLENISVFNLSEPKLTFSQADSLEKYSLLEANSYLISYEMTMLKHIFIINVIQLNALYYVLNQYLKFDHELSHTPDILDDQLNIVISVDICTLIMKINHHKYILALGPAASHDTNCQANCMRRSELLHLKPVDHENEDNEGFVGFPHYTELDSKLDKAFVKLSRIDVIENLKINKKDACIKSNEHSKYSSLTRPKLGYLFCLYCNEFQTQLPRHLVLKHKDKTFVKNFLINFDDETIKNAAQTFIRNQGFGHYYELTGKIIPVYTVWKDSQKEVIKVQCSNCFAHFSNETYQKHLKTCRKFNITDMKNKGLL